MKKIIQKNRNDIFSISFLSFIFRNKTFLFVLRATLLFLFLYAIYFGFLFQEKSENKFTTGLFWGLFWPFFMVLSLATLGRVFCGICPHAFLGKYISKFGLKKKMPEILKNPFIGLTILILGYWLLVFSFPGIYRVPYNTAIFFLVLTLISIVVFYIYKDMSYCKYICPLGTITKAFSKVSFTKLETYKEGCSTCKTFDCADACQYSLKPFTFGKKNSMEDCTLCMDCATSCDNVAFNLTKPSSTLFKKFKVTKVEVWAIVLLTAILSFAISFSHALSRTAIADSFVWIKTANYFNTIFENSLINFNSFFAFAYAIVFVLIASVGGMFIASKILKVDYEKTFYTLGYAFAPLFIIGGLSHILEFFFLHYASNIVNGFIQAFSLNFNYIEPLATRRDSWLHIFKAFSHIAYIWAFIIMIARIKLLDSTKLRKVFAFPFASLLIIFYMGLNFYTGYVFKTYGAKKKMQHNHGKHSSLNIVIIQTINKG